MREFSRDEIIDWKCENCGSRNKVYTILRSNRTNKRVGSTLKCCNCGKVFERINSVPDEFENQMHCNHPCHQYCIQIHYCPHTDCPLYGKNILDWVKYRKTPTQTDTSCDCDCDVNNGCTCNCSCCKNQFSPQLIYNVENQPKFL